MPPPKIAKALAQILSILLLVFGAYSFVPNPLVGETGIFAANAAHAGVFIALAVLLFAFTRKGESTAAAGLYGVGVIFVFLGIIGHLALNAQPFVTNAQVFGAILYSRTDVWLDAGLAAVMIVSGMMNTSRRQILKD
jgi:hypothetical protein